MEGERKSSINKIVGGDKEYSEAVGKDYEARFSKQHRYEGERKKTPQELKIIKAIVPLLHSYLAQYGAKPLPLNARHIHIYAADKMSEWDRDWMERKMEHTQGEYYQYYQGITIPDWKIQSELGFANTLVHELIHFHSYNVLRKDEKHKTPRARSIGLSSSKLRENSDANEIIRFFMGLNEAVTEELTKRFFGELKKIPALREEIGIVEIDRLWSGNEDVSAAPADGASPRYVYKDSRARLSALIDEIDAKQPGAFESKDEIFSVFAKSAMTGNVKLMAALVESLGRGRLRELARETE